MKYVIILFFILGFNSLSHLVAQAQMEGAYTSLANIPAPNVYLHLDKTHYRADETIWFTGYDCSGNDSSDILFVQLQKAVSDSLVVFERYAMRQGVSLGSIALDGKIPSGHYRILAYTNHNFITDNRLPFQQQIYIHNSFDDAVTLRGHCLASVAGERSDSFIVALEMTFPIASSKPEKMMVQVATLSGVSLLNTEHKLSSQDSINLVISKKYIHDSLLVTCKWSDEDAVSTIVCGAPPIRIDLKPEGNNFLVAQLPNSMSILVPNADQVYHGGLYDNGQLVQKFTTDRKGCAILKWIPRLGAVYTLKLDVDVPVAYTFPQVVATGTVIQINDGWVNDGKLAATIHSNQLFDTVYFIVHNPTGIHDILQASIRSGSRQLTIPIDTSRYSSGVYAFTCVSGNSAILFNRFFYINRAAEDVVRVEMEDKAIALSGAANVKIKITNSVGEKVPAIFSVAVVSNEAYYTDWVMPFAYFYKGGNQALPRYTFGVDGFGKDKALTEMLLLSHFEQQNSGSVAYPKAIHQKEENKRKKSKKPMLLSITDSLLAKGIVVETYKFNTLYDNEYNIGIKYMDDTYGIIEGTSGGRTFIPYEMLYTKKEENILISPLLNSTEKGKERFYGIDVISMEPKKYLNLEYPRMYIALDQEVDTAVFFQNENELMETVKFVGKRRSRARQQNSEAFFRECLENQKVSRSVIVVTGGDLIHAQRMAFERRKEIGFNNRYDFEAKVRSIWIGESFDNSKVPYTNATTMYWNHFIQTNERGEAEFSFSTSEIPGKATIHIHGLSENGAFSNRHTFENGH